MREFKTGDLVLLTLSSPGTVGITRGLLEYKDRKFRVEKVKELKAGTATNRSVYYELSGCVSKYGVPYAVTGDWIVPVKEIDYGKGTGQNTNRRAKSRVR